LTDSHVGIEIPILLLDIILLSSRYALEDQDRGAPRDDNHYLRCWTPMKDHDVNFLSLIPIVPKNEHLLLIWKVSLINGPFESFDVLLYSEAGAIPW
jgi:hypothetical protein